MNIYLRFGNFLKKNSWLGVVLCLLPAGIYLILFSLLALNVNYIAYDDIVILRVVPGFGQLHWVDKWKRLTELFPEHRLFFSRSIVLSIHALFGKVNLVWLMIVGNACWFGCGYIFYRVFSKTRRPLWYFVPIAWIWFNFQSYENIFWGVSSLCNFGVLFFAVLCFYTYSFHPKRFVLTILLATLATFTYGNGLMTWLVLLVMAWLLGCRKQLVVLIVFAIVINFIYFFDYTPNTKSLDITNFNQVRDGIAGFFGFIGSIATISAGAMDISLLLLATCFGLLMVLVFGYMFRRYWQNVGNALAGRPLKGLAPLMQFSLMILLFVAITSFAVVYKRVAIDEFVGMFKPRYRMYSSLALVALWLVFLATSTPRSKWRITIIVIPASIILNLTILYENFDNAIHRRQEAVALEFNSRYNNDLHGLIMFGMNSADFEKYRALYNSADPLAEGWNPIGTKLPDCRSVIKIDTTFFDSGNFNLYYIPSQPVYSIIQDDYTNGLYFILRSSSHTYMFAPVISAMPARIALRTGEYFSRPMGVAVNLNTIKPGDYKILMLQRKNKTNKMFCTNKTLKLH